MFDVAYVVLPFADSPPADAIRASLAPFQRGGRGEVPDGLPRLPRRDGGAAMRCVHAARLTFTDQGKGGLRVENDDQAPWYVDTTKVRDEMRRRGLRRWSVRFADMMDLDTFHDCFSSRLERHPVTGDYGHWLNPLGRWDWWDLGGCFDGRIIGEPERGAGRGVAAVSSGESRGRSLLANLRDQFEAALGQAPAAAFDVLSNRNVELVATLLADVRAGRKHACPGVLVLPPGAAEDRSRWLGTWPEPGPAEAFATLGLPPEASWPAVAEATYARFGDHWVAGVAYHF